MVFGQKHGGGEERPLLKRRLNIINVNVPMMLNNVLEIMDYAVCNKCIQNENMCVKKRRVILGTVSKLKKKKKTMMPFENNDYNILLNSWSF